MRRVLVAAIAFVVALSCAAAAQPAAKFVIKGRGWGHGLGLAQYGAYGFAWDGGRNYRWILDHYYTGTTLGTSGVGRVRVLAAGRLLSIGSPAAFTRERRERQVVQPERGTSRPPAEPHPDCERAYSHARQPRPFPTGVLDFSGNRYRGLCVVRGAGGSPPSSDIGLEPYVKGRHRLGDAGGLASEALKAPGRRRPDLRPREPQVGVVDDLFDDTRSQVYGGVRAENSRTNAAVDATRGEVVRSERRACVDVYHSTSGGKTASREDEWGPPGISYLVGVSDPHDDISAPQMGPSGRRGRLSRPWPGLRVVGGGI